MLGKWEEMQRFFFEIYHSDEEVANCEINLHCSMTMQYFHFWQLLKCKQKETSLDRCLVRQRPNEPEASSSGAKRQKRMNLRTVT